MRLPLAAALLVAACAREPADPAKGRVAATPVAGWAADAPFDFSKPRAALDLDPDTVARRLGAFEWVVAIDWSVSLSGEDAPRVHALEHHRLLQSATGDFEVSVELDPGLGKGSVAGRDVIFTRGMTYGRGRNAPWRERPTDRGRDARRYRDESFSTPRSAVRLLGEAVVIEPAGDLSLLGRRGKRFLVSLARAPAAAAPTPRPPGAPAPDEDTRQRLRFLDGRVPTSATGELVLDAATGAPLRVQLSAAFGVKDDPRAQASLELLAQVRVLGGEVPTVAAPTDALTDERKPAGVAGALEAAGFRKPDEDKPGRPGTRREPQE